jgi:glycosyltransferase involved in cell wall biosynthesis
MRPPIHEGTVQLFEPAARLPSRSQLDAVARVPSPVLPAIAGVRSPRSVGVARYVDHLAELLAAAGVDYLPSDAPVRGFGTHLHFANSSRRVLWDIVAARRTIVTVHDVRPRTTALTALYRGVAYPLLRRAFAIIVHSGFAANLLRASGARPRRLEVIPHPTSSFRSLDQRAARRALGWDRGRPLFVLPGVLKAAKLVAETLEAAAPLLRHGALDLALVGTAVDQELVSRARSLGALTLASPSREAYEQAVVAADCVVVLRDASVGETNGPLMDALGAGRPVLATATGSIPELAEGAALYCSPTAAGIRAGLAALCDRDERALRAETARRRGPLFDGAAVAAAHIELYRDVFGG